MSAVEKLLAAWEKISGDYLDRDTAIAQLKEVAQDREHDMDLAYAKGWNDAREGGIEVEVVEVDDSADDYLRVVLAVAHEDAEKIELDGVLLPRQVEGDDNPNENGG